MTAVLLLRHATHGDLGHRLTGRCDAGPLTVEGAAQARALARRLARAGLDAIHASPRRRTRETAEAVAEAAGLTVAVEPALDEVDFGAWTGRAFADLDGEPAWDAWNRSRSTTRPPGGEAMAEVAARLADHMGTLPLEGTVALVTHCDVIRAVVADALRLSFDHLMRFEVAPASITRLDVRAWGPTLIGLNDTAHLEAAGAPA